MNIDLSNIKENLSEEEFNLIYPDHIRDLARRHWTPLAVARSASEFLANRRGIRVLDIGSGAGKFCMVGALTTHGHFTGVEQRLPLIELSRTVAAAYNVTNVQYIHANITSISFADYQAFYLYNAFFENLDSRSSIDNTIRLDTALYNSYSLHTFEQLNALPSGTRLATYFTETSVIPESFSLINSLYNENLNLWEKVY